MSSCRQIVKFLGIARWPANRESIDLGGVAETEQDTSIVCRQITATTDNKVMLCAASRFRNQGRADGVSIAPFTVANQLDACPSVRRNCEIAKQGDSGADGGERKVGVAIIVEIRASQATTHARLNKARPAGRASVAEFSRSVTDEQLRRLRIGNAKQLLRESVHVSIRHSEIQIAVEIDVDRADAEAEALDAWATESRAETRVVEAQATAVLKKRVWKALEVGDEKRWSPRAVQIGDFDSHAGHPHTPGSQCDAGVEAFLAKTHAAEIAEQVSLAHIVGYIDFRLAIAIQVRNHDAEARGRRCQRYSRGMTDILELSVSLIAKQSMRRLRKDNRRACEIVPFLVFASYWLRRTDFDVIAHIQVQQPIAVQVAPGGARAKMGVRQARLRRDISETPTAGRSWVRFVVEERYVVQIGNEQIVESIVVVIPD